MLFCAEIALPSHPKVRSCLLPFFGPVCPEPSLSMVPFPLQDWLCCNMRGRYFEHFNLLSVRLLSYYLCNRDDDKGFAIMSRHRYPIEFCRVFKRSTSSKLKEAIAASYEQGEDEEVEAKEDGSNVLDTSKTKKNAKKGGKIPDANKTGNDGTRSKKCTLKMVIGEGLGYGPQLSEHMILDAGLTPSMKISKDNKLDEGKVEVLGQAVGRFEDWLEDVILGSKVPEGYILMQTKKPGGKDSGTTVPDHSSKVVIL